MQASSMRAGFDDTRLLTALYAACSLNDCACCGGFCRCAELDTAQMFAAGWRPITPNEKTPGPGVLWSALISLTFFSRLGILLGVPATFLRRRLHAGEQVLVHHMGVLRRGGDVSMVHAALHELEVLSLTQQLRSEGVAVIMPTEIRDASRRAAMPPVRFQTFRRK